MRTRRNGSEAGTVIVGGGITGLYCAFEHKRRWPHAPVTLLSADRQVGGRLLSLAPLEKDRPWMDLGAGRFSSALHPRLDRLLRELKLGRLPFDFSRKVFNPEFEGTGQDVADALEEAFARLSPEESRDRSFSEVVRETGGSRELERILAHEGYDVLAHPELSFAEGFRILRQHPETLENRMPWSTPEEGFQSVAYALEERVREAGVNIRRGLRVEEIRKSAEIGWMLRTHEGDSISGDRVVLTVSPADLKGLVFPAAHEVRRCLDAIEPVPLCKVFLHFQTPWWDAVDRFSGYCLITSTEARRTYLRKDGSLLIYTDSETTKFWERILDRLPDEPRSESDYWSDIAGVLRDALRLPRGFEVPFPDSIVGKLWEPGVYFWKRGRCPETVFQTLLEADPDGLHICSGDFTPMSGWVEACLFAVEALIEKLKAPPGEPR